MAEANHTCKVCGAEFHYCSSCEPEPYLDKDFCSLHCWSEYVRQLFAKDRFVPDFAGTDLFKEMMSWFYSGYSYLFYDWQEELLNTLDFGRLNLIGRSLIKARINDEDWY